MKWRANGLRRRGPNGETPARRVNTGALHEGGGEVHGVERENKSRREGGQNAADRAFLFGTLSLKCLADLGQSVLRFFFVLCTLVSLLVC